VVRAFSNGCQTLNPGRDALCDGFRGTVKPDGTIPADVNIACSDKATCAPCPPQVPSNGPNLLGNLILGDSYLGETRGLALQLPSAPSTARAPSMKARQSSASAVAA
jgi:hypothetical protein